MEVCAFPLPKIQIRIPVIHTYQPSGLSVLPDCGQANDSCAVVAIGERYVTDTAVLRRMLEDVPALQTNDTFPPWPLEHVYGALGDVTLGDVTAVLYGAIGTRAFWEMHSLLAAAAASNSGADGDFRQYSDIAICKN